MSHMHAHAKTIFKKKKTSLQLHPLLKAEIGSRKGETTNTM
jgi:hypothetical protein